MKIDLLRKITSEHASNLENKYKLRQPVVVHLEEIALTYNNRSFSAFDANPITRSEPDRCEILGEVFFLFKIYVQFSFGDLWINKP